MILFANTEFKLSSYQTVICLTFFTYIRDIFDIKSKRSDEVYHLAITFILVESK